MPNQKQSSTCVASRAKNARIVSRSRESIALLVSALLLLATVGASTGQSVQAATAADLARAIEQSKVLGPEYKVNVTLQGSEAVVSTYLNRASQDPDVDCKVDAVLVAKQAFEVDPAIARVRVLFYDQITSVYRQVTVTYGDVKSFAHSDISKQTLLNSLEVRSFDAAGNTKPTTSSTSSTSTAGTATSKSSPSTTEPAGSKTTTNNAASTIIGSTSSSTVSTAGGTTKPGEKPGSAAEVKPASTPPANAKYDLCNEQGLAFYYSKNWVRKVKAGNDPDAFVELYNTAAQEDAFIDIKVEAAASVEQQLYYDQEYWKNHRYYIYASSAPFKIGYGRKLPAISQTVVAPRRSRNEAVRFERHVYFGYPHHIYSLSLWCDEHDFEKLNAELNYMLATVFWSSQAPIKGASP